MRQKFNPLWSKLQCVNFLQQKIIKLSIAYYEYEFSFVDDCTFDDLSFQLVEMQRDCPDVHLSRYWYMMYDFDGSTGFDLPGRLTTEDKEWLEYVVSKEMGRKFRKNTRATKKHEAPVRIDKPTETAKPKKKKGRLF